jgi:hypothetical protein
MKELAVTKASCADRVIRHATKTANGCLRQKQTGCLCSLVVTVEMAAPIATGYDRPQATRIGVWLRNRWVETTEASVCGNCASICGVVFIERAGFAGRFVRHVWFPSLQNHIKT